MTTDKSADDAAFDDVFSSGRDRGANAEAPPRAEPVASPVPREQPQPEKQLDLEEAISAVDAGRMVPLSELTGERKKYREKLAEESRQRIEWETRAKLYQEQAERASQPQRQQPQRQIQAPDPFTDPEGYANHVAYVAEQRLETERLHNSEERARDKFGDAEVTAAFEAAQRAGLIQRRVFIEQNPRHPWGELMTWHKQQKVLAAVGDDPDAYEKKVEERVRQRLAEEAAKGGAGQPAAAQQRFPGTLADNTAAGTQGAHLTEGAAVASVFDSNRKRK